MRRGPGRGPGPPRPEARLDDSLLFRFFDWFDPRFRRVVLAWAMLFALILIDWALGWRVLSGLGGPALIVAGAAGVFLFAVRPRGAVGGEWIVRVEDDAIVTTAPSGEERRVAVRDLRRVAIATDDSGPWGCDLVFLLFTDEAAPAAGFPLDAAGAQAVSGWLAERPGFDAQAFIAAMGSTDLNWFEVYVVPAD